MRQIWVVIGETGIGCDKRRWIVEAYDDEEAAQRRVRQLAHLLAEMYGLGGHWRNDDRREKEEMIRSHPDGDPAVSIDRSGTTYGTERCRLRCIRRGRQAEAIAVVALTVALDALVLWWVWKWQPGRVIGEWMFDWLAKKGASW